MSQCLKELYKLLQIKSIRTSVYHPQTNGLVEQRHWAKLLPFLMFAVREVPQSSTGFSPFELLYGRQPRGILDLVKEGWEEQTKTSKNIVKYVILLRDRLELVGRLAQENLKLAQHRQEQQYNKQARIRTFRPGDKVLLLLPSSESKLYAKWQGPYEVIRGIGNVNYEIRQPNRRNKTEIYHINLLKPWNEREALFIAGDSLEEDFGPTVNPLATTNILMGEQLLPDQKRELFQLVERFGDVFSDLPGRTNVISHAIITPPGVREKR